MFTCYIVSIGSSIINFKQKINAKNKKITSYKNLLDVPYLLSHLSFTLTILPGSAMHSVYKDSLPVPSQTKLYRNTIYVFEK